MMLFIRQTVAWMYIWAAVLWLALAGCDQPQWSEKPSEGPRTAVQVTPTVSPDCFIEGFLVPAHCNPGTFPSCPAEDSDQHDGQPCFWVDPDGRGLLWSDGRASTRP